MSGRLVTIEVHDMDTFHPPEYTLITTAYVHEGALLIIQGTNGKDIGWVDMRRAFKGRVYRHHWIEPEAEAELSAISSAIGTTRFMDPPDGGSVTLSQQVGRMREALMEAEAERDKLREALATFIRHYDPWMERLSDGDDSPSSGNESMGDKP